MIVCENRILIYCPNWLGDSIMSMPAIQAFSRSNQNTKIGVITTPSLFSLWKMQPCVHDILPFQNTAKELLKTVASIKQYAPAKIFIMPNSFRSAIIPFLANVPQRIGFRGHFRSLLLTKTIEPEKNINVHQSMEYYALFNIPPDRRQNELPILKIPETEMLFAQTNIPSGKINFAIIPGAARGPAKRWPITYFIQLVNKLYKVFSCNIILLGSANEYNLCYEIQKNATGEVVNLAGKTSIKQLAAILSQCHIVVCNDSGGMHLAAAVGAKVVAIYGITNPAQTGPLGKGHVVITAEGFIHDRKVPRFSSIAEKALHSITPEKVFNIIERLVG